MQVRDHIGNRGEDLFRTAISKWCGGRPWFRGTPLGEKAEGLDFMVTLIEPTVFAACFFVQVKATMKKKRYSGTGRNRRILIGVKRSDVEKLRAMGMPAYVVGIDIVSEKAYIKAITPSIKRGMSGIPTRAPLNCKTIRKLWDEVEDFYQKRPGALMTSFC
jgi:hypothetical protein